MTSALRPGVETLVDERPELVVGRSVGLLTHPAGVDHQLHSTADLLTLMPGVRLQALFGPEHGLLGAAAAGEAVVHARYARLDVPVYSLYGPGRELANEALAELDVLLVDLQDVGSRYFTYPATLLQVMQTCAEAGVSVVVLDRPNPITGALVEGPVLETRFRSIVGAHEVPVRHGLTLGELALLMKSAHRHADGTRGIDVDLAVIPLAGWHRANWFDETGLAWVPPSPNLPTLSAAIQYPGTCLIEGTNVSEGRGTPLPFEQLGAPWIDGNHLAKALNERKLPGVLFRATAFTPTASKHAGVLCSGVQLHVTDRTRFRPLWTALELLAALLHQYPDEFAWCHAESGTYAFDRLIGNSRARRELHAGRDPLGMLGDWHEDHRIFLNEREPFLLYGQPTY